MGDLLEVDQDEVLIDDRGSLYRIPFRQINRAKTIFLGNWSKEDER